MKLKRIILTILTLFAFLFFSCEGLFEDDNNENPPDTGNLPGNNFVYEVGTVLLQTKWNQSSPYNDMFPYIPEHSKANSRNGRLVTDCGTTAATQIIAYHRHPNRATGQSSILGPHGIEMQQVNFENYPFDWANIRNTYTAADSGTVHGNAVAQLNYIYGMARGNGGGFSKILIDNFGYDKSFQTHYRRFYNDIEWENLIRKQLDAGLPVFYYGNYPTDAASSDGYHAFVVDGYDNSGKFHANWGWGGGHDGWYFINDFDPEAPASTYAGEYIYINIKPNTGSTGSNEFGLDAFSADKTDIQQNELFKVSFTLRSFGFTHLSHLGMALVDSNGNITQVIGTRNYNFEMSPGTRTSENLTIDCFAPETVNPGQYRVMAVARPTDGDWKIVTRSAIRNDVPSAVNINVTENANSGGYGMGLTKFSPSKTSATVNEQFQVEYGIRNMSNEPVSGVYRGIALVDNSGNFTVIGSFGNTSVWNPGSSNNNLTINCTVPPDTQTGSYQLRVVIRTTDNNEWRFATLSNDGVPTSIDFTVQ